MQSRKIHVPCCTLEFFSLSESLYKFRYPDFKREENGFLKRFGAVSKNSCTLLYTGIFPLSESLYKFRYPDFKREENGFLKQFGAVSQNLHVARHTVSAVFLKFYNLFCGQLISKTSSIILWMSRAVRVSASL